MLPATYELPAAALLVIAGLLACFAGYRLFRLVLTVYGFVLGALFASTLVAPSNVPAMLVTMLVGGLLGALVLFAGYFAGVMLVGAGFGALAAHAVWTQWRGEPGVLVVIVFAAIGAGLALVFQRVIVIVATAFLGAQTAVAGLVTLLGHRGIRHLGADAVWIGHLGTPAAGRQWPFIAWLVLGLVGTLSQLGSTSGRQKRRA